MIELKGKKILLFAPYTTTRHYGLAIIEELKRRGADVKEYDERPSTKTLSKIIIRLLKTKVPEIFNRYIKKVIKQNIDINFDFILICRGEAFTPQAIQLLKDAYPDAKLILYLWDVLRSQKVGANIPYVDYAYSFDPQDVEENTGLIFRPTFFVNDYKNVRQDIERTKDVVFIGTLHSNRYKIISHISESFKSQNIDFFKYLFIPSRIVYIKDLIKKFPYINYKKVHFTPLSLSDTVDLLGSSKAILDINYYTQKSLSTRAYEAMAAKRKYITTNPEIKNYDFYNPNNIAIIDINKPILPNRFLDTPFEEVRDDILYKYSIPGLIDDLFSESLVSGEKFSNAVL